MDKTRTQELRSRRIANAKAKEQERKLAKHGASIRQTMLRVLGVDFAEYSASHPDWSEVFKITPRIEQSPGLVVAYTSEVRVRQILKCIEERLGGEVSALIRFEEGSYMGTFSCPRLRLTAIADLAHELEDRVFIFLPQAAGGIVVDFYEQKAVDDGDFSVVVQGSDLERRVQHCYREYASVSNS